MSDFAPGSHEDAAEDFPLAPAEEPLREQWEAAEARRKLLRAAVRPVVERERFQYSLGELAALMTFAGAVLSAAHYLPLPVFAGLVGTAAVVAMYCDHLIPPRWRWLRAAWMGLAAGYLITAAAATFLK